jgi:hypothetical protein
MCAIYKVNEVIKYIPETNDFTTMDGDIFVPKFSCQLSCWKFNADWKSHFFTLEGTHLDLGKLSNSNLSPIGKANRLREFFICKGLKSTEFTECMKVNENKYVQKTSKRDFRSTCVRKIVSSSFNLNYCFEFVLFVSLFWFL